MRLFERLKIFEELTKIVKLKKKISPLLFELDELLTKLIDPFTGDAIDSGSVGSGGSRRMKFPP